MTNRKLQAQYLEFNTQWTAWNDGTQSIEIARDLRDWNLVCIVLLHEMVHAACHLLSLDDHLAHGRSFEEERQRIINLGAFTPYL